MSSSESFLYQIYKEQFNTILNHLQKQIASISYSNDLCRSSLEIEKNIRECESSLKQLELEISINMGNTNCEKNKMFLHEIAEMKKSLNDLTLKYKNEKENIQNKNDFSVLLINYNDHDTSSEISLSHNERLLSQSSEPTHKIIPPKSENTHNIIQIELRKKEVPIEVQSPKGRIMNLKLNIDTISNSLAQSKCLFERLMARQNRKKALLAIFSCTLICMFLLIVYRKY